MCLCVVCMYVQTWKSELNFKYHSLGTIHLASGDRVFHWHGSHWVGQAGWPVNPRDLSVFTSQHRDFNGSCGVWTQIFTLGHPVLYWLSHLSSCWVKFLKAILVSTLSLWPVHLSFLPCGRYSADACIMNKSFVKHLEILCPIDAFVFFEKKSMMFWLG